MKPTRTTDYVALSYDGKTIDDSHHAPTLFWRKVDTGAITDKPTIIRTVKGQWFWCGARSRLNKRSTIKQISYATRETTLLFKHGGSRDVWLADQSAMIPPEGYFFPHILQTQDDAKLVFDDMGFNLSKSQSQLANMLKWRGFDASEKAWQVANMIADMAVRGLPFKEILGVRFPESKDVENIADWPRVCRMLADLRSTVEAQRVASEARDQEAATEKARFLTLIRTYDRAIEQLQQRLDKRDRMLTTLIDDEI